MYKVGYIDSLIVIISLKICDCRIDFLLNQKLFGGLNVNS